MALVEDSTTLTCVSADPIANEVFWGVGERAWLRRGGSDQPLQPTAASGLVEVNGEGRLDEKFLGPQLLTDRNVWEAFGLRVLSTTLALAWVAAGRRAGYVSDGLFLDNVHFAAGIGLCRAAGCLVTALDGGPLYRSRGLIAAADPATHARLVELVRPHLAAATGSSCVDLC